MGARPGLKNEAGGGWGWDGVVDVTSEMSALIADLTRAEVESFLKECAERLPTDVLLNIHDRAAQNYRKIRWPYINMAPELRTSPPNYRATRETQSVWMFGQNITTLYAKGYDFKFLIGDVSYQITISSPNPIPENEYYFQLLRHTTDDSGAARITVVARGGNDVRPVWVAVFESRSWETQTAVYALFTVMKRYLGDELINNRTLVEFKNEEEYRRSWSVRRYLYENLRKNWRRRPK